MWSRPKRFTALLASLAVTAFGVLWLGGTTPAAAAPDVPGTMPGGWVTTQWGPLGPADRDLLIKVRQAGLWEMTAGEMAQERAASARVKEVGRIIADQHADLDRQTLQAAARLGVGLPADPNADQKEFLETLGQLRGDAFDRAYAQLLRDAHGKVFTVIAGVRAGTRNEMMRAFAEVGNGFVMTHMRLLESTTFVNYNALPDAPPPPPGAAAMAAAAQAAGLPGIPASPAFDPAVLWVVLAVAVIAALATTVRVFRRS